MRRFSNGCSRGFTIVETIVSVAIIGILAAAVVSTILGKSQAVQADHASTVPQAIAIQGGDNSTQAASQTLDSLSTIADDTDVTTQTAVVAGRMELRIIQTAMDLMMVTQEIHSVVATPDTSDMSSFPAGRPLYPKYVREVSSQYSYRCDSSGEVTQILK